MNLKQDRNLVYQIQDGTCGRRKNPETRNKARNKDRQERLVKTAGWTTLLPAIATCLAFWALTAPPAVAQEFDTAGACLEERAAADAPLADCIVAAQAVCLSFPAPSLAGAECYRNAKDHWGGLIAARMEEIRAVASEELAAIAGIEVKYDLRGNLLQCDRMEELSLVQKDPDEETVYARMRCEATAVGLAYAKFHYQSREIE